MSINLLKEIKNIGIIFKFQAQPTTKGKGGMPILISFLVETEHSILNYDPLEVVQLHCLKASYNIKHPTL